MGVQFGQELAPNSVVCFFGDLGAGKTTFIKGAASAIAGCSPDEVMSPTYVYLNIYKGKVAVYHFDLYRLSCAEEFMGMGFDEMFESGGVCCVEWSERIVDILPAEVIRVTITSQPDESRIITIEGNKK